MGPLYDLNHEGHANTNMSSSFVKLKARELSKREFNIDLLKNQDLSTARLGQIGRPQSTLWGYPDSLRSCKMRREAWKSITVEDKGQGAV